MGIPTLGRLVQVPLRDVWSHEALSFTQWLAEPENLDVLADAIDLELTDARTEVGVGPFRVDILARDVVSDKPVIIENQLEASDHDHLGKTITYAAGLDAESIVWIVRSAREEHERAVEWLNEHTTTDLNFFLIEAQAWRIGDSAPAPVFEVVAKPNGWARRQKMAATEARQDFDQDIKSFYERVRENGMQRARHIASWRSAPGRRYYDVAIGSTEAHLVLRVTTQEQRVSVELYINDNKELFESIRSRKVEIESELGFELDWMPLPTKKASRIVRSRAGSFSDESVAAELIAWLVDTADTFARVFPKYL